MISQAVINAVWFLTAVMFACAGIVIFWTSVMELRRNNEILICRHNIALIDLELAKRKLYADLEEKK